jgi:hypothetical protein
MICASRIRFSQRRAHASAEWQNLAAATTRRHHQEREAIMRTLFFSAILLAACSSSEPRSGFDQNGSTAGFDPNKGNGTSGSIGSSGAATTGDDGCSAEARLVYVVSSERDLYRFEPDKLAFTKIGPLTCPAPGAQPNSMAIDRKGTAWVNYSNGSIWKVSTKDASCQPTSYVQGQNGIMRFGMAFVSSAPGSKEETLFVAGLDESAATAGRGLFKIDTTTMALTSIGDYTGELRGRGAELTGTGDARLYGFFTTQPQTTLAKIEQASAATTEHKPLDGVPTPAAWAFSFWGGDFWFYTSPGAEPSRVTRLHTADGKIEVVRPDVGGFRIVGAGVSTCAPLTSPH